MENYQVGIKKNFNKLACGFVSLRLGKKITLLYASEEFFNIIGYTRKEFLYFNQQNIKHIIPEQDFLKLIAILNPRHTKKDTKFELSIVKKNGRTTRLIINGHYTQDLDGQQILQVAVIDITAIIEQQNILFEFMDSIPGGAAKIKFSANHIELLFASGGFYRLGGYTRDEYEMLKCNVNGFRFAVSEDAQNLVRTAVSQIENGENAKLEFRIRHKDSRIVWVMMQSSTIRKEKSGYIASCVFSDITEQKRLTEHLRRKAQLDPLTKLYNKITCEKLINKSLMESSQNQHHAMMVIDIDNFKGVNDHLGHLFGDTVLGEIAAKMRHVLDESVVIGRVGGDEFVVFVQNVTMCEVVEKYAEIICNIFRCTYLKDRKDCKISGSVGIAMYPQDGTSYMELFSNADQALYCAKNQGKNRCELFKSKTFNKVTII